MEAGFPAELLAVRGVAAGRRVLPGLQPDRGAPGAGGGADQRGAGDCDSAAAARPGLPQQGRGALLSGLSALDGRAQGPSRHPGSLPPGSPSLPGSRRLHTPLGALLPPPGPLCHPLPPSPPRPLPPHALRLQAGRAAPVGVLAYGRRHAHCHRWWSWSDRAAAGAAARHARLRGGGHHPPRGTGRRPAGGRRRTGAAGPGVGHGGGGRRTSAGRGRGGVRGGCRARQRGGPQGHRGQGRGGAVRGTRPYARAYGGSWSSPRWVRTPGTRATRSSTCTCAPRARPTRTSRVWAPWTGRSCAPVRSTDEAGTGLVRLEVSTGRGPVPRDDVAAVLAELLEPRDGRSTLVLVSGSTPVAAAVNVAGNRARRAAGSVRTAAAARISGTT
ncbi:hypothetical protein SGLAM104S_05830 [Streptomyces glaucescens]